MNYERPSGALRKRLPIYAMVLIIVVVGAGLVGCSREKPATVSAAETMRGVLLVSAKQTTVPDYFEGVGTVRAAQSSAVAAQMMANIVAMQVHEGDRVKQGQVLAVLDDDQSRAGLDRATAAQSAAQQQVAAAEAQFNLAQATLNRYQDLFNKKSVTPQEFDEVKARFQAATAQRDMARAGEKQAAAAVVEARTAFEYTRIRAPFDGVVTEKKADAGTLASPGMQLFTVEDTRVYRLEATVDEGEMRYIRMGENVPIAIDALGAELKGRVVQIVPVADPASRSFLVKIQLPADAQLRSGLFGRAHFPRGERSSLLVPRDAVVDRGQLQGVYVLDQKQIASLRFVTLGKPFGEQVEVLSGLEGSETLIAAPGTVDFSGKRIEAR